MNIVKEWTSLTMPELFTIASLERLEGDLHLIFPHVPLTTQQVKGLIFIECIRVDKFLSIKIKRHKRCKRMLFNGAVQDTEQIETFVCFFLHRHVEFCTGRIRKSGQVVALGCESEECAGVIC